MPKLNKKILEENIEQVLNNFDIDKFSKLSTRDFKWLVKHLSDCFE